MESDNVTEEIKKIGYTIKKQKKGAVTMAVLNMNHELFNKKLQENEKPVLVEYSAPWCGYCRRIEPAYKKIGEQFEEELIVAKVDIDENPKLAEQEQIEVIPTLVIYKDGAAVDSIVAPESKARIESFIREYLAEK